MNYGKVAKYIGILGERVRFEKATKALETPLMYVQFLPVVLGSRQTYYPIIDIKMVGGKFENIKIKISL